MIFVKANPYAMYYALSSKWHCWHSWALGVRLSSSFFWAKLSVWFYHLYVYVLGMRNTKVSEWFTVDREDTFISIIKYDSTL